MPNEAKRTVRDWRASQAQHSSIALAMFEAIEDPNAVKIRAQLPEWLAEGRTVRWRGFGLATL